MYITQLALLHAELVTVGDASKRQEDTNGTQGLVNHVTSVYECHSCYGILVSGQHFYITRGLFPEHTVWNAHIATIRSRSTASVSAAFQTSARSAPGDRDALVVEEVGVSVARSLDDLAGIAVRLGNDIPATTPKVSNCFFAETYFPFLPNMRPLTLSNFEDWMKKQATKDQREKSITYASCDAQ